VADSDTHTSVGEFGRAQTPRGSDGLERERLTSQLFYILESRYTDALG